MIGRRRKFPSAGTRMTEVAQPNAFELGCGPDDPPDTVEAASAEATFTVAAKQHPRAVLPSRQRFQKTHRRRRQLDRAGTGLGIGETELAAGMASSMAFSESQVGRAAGRGARRMSSRATRADLIPTGRPASRRCVPEWCWMGGWRRRGCLVSSS